MKKDKILNINDFAIKATKEAEIEDLMDVLEIEESFNREFRFEEDFIYDENDNNSEADRIILSKAKLQIMRWLEVFSR